MIFVVAKKILYIKNKYNKIIYQYEKKYVQNFKYLSSCLNIFFTKSLSNKIKNI